MENIFKGTYDPNPPDYSILPNLKPFFIVNFYLFSLILVKKIIDTLNI